MTTWRSRRGSGTRLSPVIATLVLIWLIIGAVAAGQRHYYGGKDKPTCAKVSTIAVTVVAGPLNYLGVNPKLKCKLPQPSK
jgi:membrane protein YdbS with pleckstrin-like domain